MSALLFVGALIALVWIVPLLVSRSLGTRPASRYGAGLLLLVCVVLGAGFYVFYIAEDGAAMVLGVMEVGGFIGDVFKLVLAVGGLWCVGYAWWNVARISGGRGCIAVVAVLALTVVFVPAAFLLALQALVGIFS
jgi:hypothetical protein